MADPVAEKVIKRVSSARPGVLVVEREDGSVEELKGSRATRNNNPGNIEYGKVAKASGAVGSDGRFAVFPTAAAGMKAQEDLLFNSGSYKNRTL
ncbi:MAG: hypothetical protein ACRCUS_01595, partial [Anaerovoracaceae bacterium]